MADKCPRCRGAKVVCCEEQEWVGDELHGCRMCCNHPIECPNCDGTGEAEETDENSGGNGNG